jgi:hypothetical protein
MTTDERPRNFTDADIEALMTALGNFLANTAGKGLFKLAAVGLVVIMLFLAWLGLSHA